MARHRWTVVFVAHSVYQSVDLPNRIAVMSRRPGRAVGAVGVVAAYLAAPRFAPRGATTRTAGAAGLHEAMANC